VKHRKHFLGLAQGENGNEHASAAGESAVDRFGQTALFTGASSNQPAWRDRLACIP
jgi:hypothetical protein